MLALPAMVAEIVAVCGRLTVAFRAIPALVVASSPVVRAGAVSGELVAFVACCSASSDINAGQMLRGLTENLAFEIDRSRMTWNAFLLLMVRATDFPTSGCLK